MSHKNKRTRSRLTPRLGIDIGRVIMAPVVGGKADTSFLSGSLSDAMETPMSPHAEESIRHLVDRFEGEVWIVSKAGTNVQNKSLAWFKHNDFFQRTGVPAANVRFCRERSGKRIHCQENRLTHFIDDRVDVLRHLVKLVPHLFLFGEQKSGTRPPYWATHVLDWHATVEAVEAALPHKTVGAA